MTALAPAASAGPAAAEQGPLRRYRTLILILTALAVATVFAALGTGPRHSGVDDPQNPHPEGARALARVLGREGVEVKVVRGADALDATPVDADTTVLVTSTENLGPSTVHRLEQHLGVAQLVLVEPRFEVAGLFGQESSQPLLDRTRTTGRCVDLRFNDLHLDVEAATAYPQTQLSCFPTPQGSLLVGPQSDLIILGSTDLLSNQQVTRADNAAVALRLLGQSPKLVWYVPDRGDLAAGDGATLGSVLPHWLRPGLVLVSVALLSVLWWRGRRLGRLAVEPLPVVVTAIESTRSRGRLYRKVNDRAHAATQLRAAARRRLAEQLNLPRASAEDPVGLVRDVAPHSRLDHAQLDQLLSPAGPVPGSDHDLIRLANDLAALMKEVHDS